MSKVRFYLKKKKKSPYKNMAVNGTNFLKRLELVGLSVELAAVICTTEKFGDLVAPCSLL